jgi:hypothetical protein
MGDPYLHLCQERRVRGSAPHVPMVAACTLAKLTWVKDSSAVQAVIGDDEATSAGRFFRDFSGQSQEFCGHSQAIYGLMTSDQSEHH